MANTSGIVPSDADVKVDEKRFDSPEYFGEDATGLPAPDMA